MTGCKKRKYMDVFVWHVSLIKHEAHYLILPSSFHRCCNSCISIKKTVYRYFESQFNTMINSLSSHLCTNGMICKLNKALYFSLAEHVLLTTKEASQSEEEPEIVIDEYENRKITAVEALKKLDEVKNFIEVNGSDHFNMIFNESIENVKQMKLKNQNQNFIYTAYSYRMKKTFHLNLCCLFLPPKSKTLYSGHFF